MIALLLCYLGSVNGEVCAVMITATKKKGFYRCNFLIMFYVFHVIYYYIHSPPYETVELPENMPSRAAMRKDFGRALRCIAPECYLRPADKNLVYIHIYLKYLSKSIILHITRLIFWYPASMKVFCQTL